MEKQGTKDANFQYRSLDRKNRGIRLLTCSSVEKRSSGRYVLEIKHVSLDDRLNFVALSYTWGSGDPLVCIALKYDQTASSSLMIRPNLLSALPRLVEFANGRPFWIDAISINQGDDDEKSWQVDMMRSIYQTAASVFIWLGPAYDDGARVLRCLDNLGKTICDEPEMFKWELRFWSLMFPSTRYRGDEAAPGENHIEKLLQEHAISDEPGAEIPYAATQKFLQRGWWQRLWVLQEVVLPAMAESGSGRRKRLHDIAFACGAARSCLYRLAPALTLVRLKAFELMGMLHAVEHTWSALLDRRPFLMMSARMWAAKVPLITLLCATSPYTVASRKLHAADPRDRVYALLGISQEGDELGVKPDYTETCKTLYVRVANALIKKYTIMTVLNSHFPKNLGSLPS